MSRSVLVPTPSAASATSLALLAALGAPWLLDEDAPAAITSAGCCLGAPGRQRVRGARKDAYILGIRLGEAADEETMSTDLQRHPGRQRDADSVPVRVVNHIVDCPTPKDQARGVTLARRRGKNPSGS